MTLPVWPEGVPSCPLGGSFRVARTVEAPLATDMNAGTSRRRRKTTLRIGLVSMALRMDAAQLALFQAFHEDDLGDGAARFSMPIAFGGPAATYVVLFKEPPAYEPGARGFTTVGLQLLVESLRAGTAP